jgi:hypothetical protein
LPAPPCYDFNFKTMIELKKRPHFPLKPIFQGAPTLLRDGYQFFRSKNTKNRAERDILLQLVESEVHSYYIMEVHDFGKTRAILAIGFPHNKTINQQ